MGKSLSARVTNLLLAFCWVSEKWLTPRIALRWIYMVVWVSLNLFCFTHIYNGKFRLLGHQCEISFKEYEILALKIDRTCQCWISFNNNKYSTFSHRRSKVCSSSSVDIGLDWTDPFLALWLHIVCISVPGTRCAVPLLKLISYLNNWLGNLWAYLWVKYYVSNDSKDIQNLHNLWSHTFQFCAYNYEFCL